MSTAAAAVPNARPTTIPLGSYGDRTFLASKLLIFTAVFIGSSFLIRPDTYYLNSAGGWFSSQSFSGYDHIRLTLRQSFLFGCSIRELLKFIARVIFASFLKDAVVSVCTPERYKTTISTRLINNIEGGALNESWIPVSESEWRAHKEAMEKGTAYEKSSHTFIYSFGSSFISGLTMITSFTAKIGVNTVLFVQTSIDTMIRTCVGMLVFIARGIFCTISSMFLVVLYSTQMILRTIKQVYSLLLSVLGLASTVTNDLSLLSLDLVSKSVVHENEDLFQSAKGTFSSTEFRQTLGAMGGISVFGQPRDVRPSAGGDSASVKRAQSPASSVPSDFSADPFVQAMRAATMPDSPLRISSEEEN